MLFVTRLWRLLVGLLGFGLGIALLVHADLGLGPWDVLHQGLSSLTGIPIGTVGIIVGALLLVTWIWLPVRVGLGTVLNTVLIGVIIDVTLWLLPATSVTPFGVRVAEVPTGIVLIALGSGFYIGSGLGAGPRDGLMTGLAARGVGSVRAVRTGIEVSVLVLGWLLGGTVGWATALFAVSIGPLVHVFLERFDLDTHSGRENPRLDPAIPPRTETVTPPR